MIVQLRRIMLFSCLLIIHPLLFSQSFSINTDGSTANASAILDVKSTLKGILIPRMDKTARKTISSPATGLMVYQTGPDSTGFYYYNGAGWYWLLSSGNTDTLAWKTIGNAGTSAATNYIGTSDGNDLVIKTTGAERMRILTSTGKVGVGTSSPGEKMEINGNLKFTGTDTIYAGSGTTNMFIHAGDGTASGGSFLIRAGNAGPSTGGTGGDLTLIAGGNMPQGGAGYGNLGVCGNVNITGGYGYNSAGGNINITAGQTSYWALTGGSHSDVIIKGGQNTAAADASGITVEGGHTFAGDASNTTGGDLILKPGSGSGASGNSGTIQLNGSITLGVSLGIAGGTGGSPVSLLNQKAYLGLSPVSGTNNNYILPAPASYSGRTYIIRNNSSVNSAILTSSGGALFYPGSSSTGTASYTLNPTTSVKTVMVISDGSNWTIMQMN